jgi:hypothetical protein
MPDRPSTIAASSAGRSEIVESIYDGGLKNGWQNWGWTPVEMKPSAPAMVRFDQYGGWMLSKVGLGGNFGGLLFRVKEPPGEGEFLEAHLVSVAGAMLARVKVSPDDRTEVGDGWTEVYLSMDRLNPGGVPFDRVVLQSFRPYGVDPVPIDKIALTAGSPRTAPPRPVASVSEPTTSRRVAMSIDCRAKATKISSLIYGAVPDKDAPPFGITTARWGGNLTSTYNWEANAWNAGSDWFFENRDAPPYTQILHENAARRTPVALTVPIMGWVAKDKTSWSFPVSLLGPQEKTDPYRPDVGNGMDKSGKPISTSRERAYIPITPAFVKQWIEAIRKEDAKTGNRSIAMYILDNEPMLWPSTHRDAHPEPTSYDEIVQRAIDYGTAIREADPGAVIAGPAEWGWTGYMYSAKDIANGGTVVRPDRRAHGDMPVIAYYLKALAEHEKTTGVRVLDLLDLHAYPYPDGVYSDAADPNTAALRIRTTRMLWDPTYVDESWVKEPVKLLPRMREWIDQNYPGRGMSIGEWNFGGARHMSGALATAETLGRFAQFGVTSAYYWTSPPEGSPGMWAFRAYRDYDGKGARFLDWFTPTTVDHPGEEGLFASRDDSGQHLVAIALNFSPSNAVVANVDVSSCGNVESAQAYTYQGGAQGFTQATAAAAGTKLVEALPAYSITVLDVRLGGGTPLVR